MWDWLRVLFESDSFMGHGFFIPHGYCFLWKPDLMSLHVLSDAVIALAYYSIPFALLTFVRKRRDVPFNWMFLLFSIFILACGTTHVMDIITVWQPLYWLDGWIKAVTAVASIGTAILLWPLLPHALRLPSNSQLAQINRDLAFEVQSRQAREAEISGLNLTLQRRASELEATNRELEAFSYSVSHDLRAPLRAIDGFARIVVDDYSVVLADEARRYLQFVLENVQQMGQLIDDLLNLSKIGRQSLQKVTLSPRKIIDQIIEQWQPQGADRNITFAIDDLPDCVADPVGLRQVWDNLIGNAIKYTRYREAAVIRIGVEWAGEQPIYKIQDNGTGFEMVYAEKIFEVFQRLHRSTTFEGTGVGLAIVKRIIERHGGTIWVEAEPEVGTTFYFTLGGE